MYKKCFDVATEDVNFVNEVLPKFTDDANNWLQHPSRVAKKENPIRVRIESLNYTYLRLIKKSQIWGDPDLVELEMQAQKKTTVAEKLFVTCYLMDWVIKAPETIDEDFLMHHLTDRPSWLHIIKHIYTKS